MVYRISVGRHSSRGTAMVVDMISGKRWGCLRFVGRVNERNERYKHQASGVVQGNGFVSARACNSA